MKELKSSTQSFTHEPKWGIKESRQVNSWSIYYPRKFSLYIYYADNLRSHVLLVFTHQYCALAYPLSTLLVQKGPKCPSDLSKQFLSPTFYIIFIFIIYIYIYIWHGFLFFLPILLNFFPSLSPSPPQSSLVQLLC